MMRGGPRGRGGPGRRPMGPGVPPPAPAPISHFPFDTGVCQDFGFERARDAMNDEPLQDALLKRNNELSATAQEQGAILNLVTQVQTVLDNIIVSPTHLTACAIDEVRQVGSFKKGTMMHGKNVADIAVILRTLPTREAVESLMSRVRDDLKKTAPGAVHRLTATDGGFEIASQKVASVQVLVTTVHQNIRNLDPTCHLNPDLVKAHLTAVRHSRWFEENAHHSVIKLLVRILKDLRNRFEGLQPLSVWHVELLAHFAVVNNPSHAVLSLPQAFKRCLQLLAAGLLLPGSVGIYDPCEGPHIRIHTSISMEDQDAICQTAQTLLRVLAHGGYKKVLGFEGNSSIMSVTSVWDGVVVTPGPKVYDKAEAEARGTNGENLIAAEA